MIERDIEIKGEVAKLSKNHPPAPSIIKISPPAEKFDVESLSTCLKRARIPRQYIPLIIQSHRQTFESPTLQFIYKDEGSGGQELMEYIRQFSECVTGRAMKPKAELVFDLEFEHNGFMYQFFNVFLSNVNFDSVLFEDKFAIVMDFTYDLFRRDFVYKGDEQEERNDKKEDS